MLPACILGSCALILFKALDESMAGKVWQVQQQQLESAVCTTVRVCITHYSWDVHFSLHASTAVRQPFFALQRWPRSLRKGSLALKLHMAKIRNPSCDKLNTQQVKEITSSSLYLVGCYDRHASTPHQVPPSTSSARPEYPVLLTIEIQTIAACYGSLCSPASF